MKELLKLQRYELEDHMVYRNLSKLVKTNNKEFLKQMADIELKHYNIIKDKTKIDVMPSKFNVFFYTYVSKILGLPFGLKLMEKREKKLIENLKDKIILENLEDEEKYLNKLKEERIDYASSIVLGLNDALVELSGALTGISFALQNTKIVAAVGLITGISASLSMAASEYLSSREEKNKNALKSSIYTGIAYIITVTMLIIPFIIFTNIFYALISMFLVVIFVIFIYTYYISISKSQKFSKRFFEMISISLSVAIISFLLGIIVKIIFKV